MSELKKISMLAGTCFIISAIVGLTQSACDYTYTPPYNAEYEDFLYNCVQKDKFSLTECEIAWQEKETLKAQERQAQFYD